jgi:predicted RNA binding protein YcfA (HicA-like mRNA interferase family)
MNASLPAITGKQLITLLKRDSWQERGKARHGIALSKEVDGRNLVTVIPDTKVSLPDGTLGAILSVKQTRIGKQGLRELIRKYNL